MATPWVTRGIVEVEGVGDGKLVVAFSKFYAVGTNTMAEVKAILDGLSLCVEDNLVEVER